MREENNLNTTTQTVNPAPMPAAPQNVAPTPMPTVPQEVVPVPMPAQPQPVVATPLTTQQVVASTPVVPQNVEATKLPSIEEAVADTEAQAQKNEEARIQAEQRKSELAAEEAKKIQEVAPQKTIVNPEEVNLSEVTPVALQNQPVGSEQVITPVASEVTPVSEINTSKSKDSNGLFFIVIIVLVIGVVFIDKIQELTTEDNFQYLNLDTSDVKSNNLVNGFIKVGQKNSFIKLKKVKFYNFKQGNDTTITLDYIADNVINNPDSLEVYVEIYNSNQILIYKELFSPGEKIAKGDVSIYTMKVTNDVYQGVFYAKVINYTKDEIKSTQSVTCTKTEKLDNATMVYKNTYNFINNELKNFDVSMSYTTNTSTTNNKDAEKFKLEVTDAYNELVKYNITNKYSTTALSYSIDLGNYAEGYTPYYELNTVPNTIKSKEKLKKWTCE